MVDADLATDRRTVLASSAAAVTAALAGCIGDTPGDDVEESRKEQFDGSGLAALTVQTVNGKVRVEGTDSETVDLRVVKRADSQGALEEMTVATTREDGRLAVDVDGDADFDLDGGSAQVDLELSVPVDLRVARAETTNGVVDVTDVSGALRAKSTNGEVTVSDVDGDVDAETTTGRVAVSGVEGDVAAEATTGTVDVDDVDGDVTAETTAGDVTVSSVTGDATVDSGAGEVSVDDVDGSVRT